MTAALSTPLFCTRSSVESVRGSATFAGAADAARAACAPEAVKAPDSVAAPINAVEAKACLRFMRTPWWLDAAGPTGAGLRRSVRQRPAHHALNIDLNSVYCTDLYSASGTMHDHFPERPMARAFAHLPTPRGSARAAPCTCGRTP